MSTSLLSLRPGLPQDTPEGPGESALPKLPARYSEALHVAIVELICKGQSPQTASAKAGLPKNEFHSWMQSVANGKAHPSIIQFAEDVERGASIAEASFVDTIVDDEKDKADNAKWMLERTRSRDFSPKVTTVVTSELESAIDRLLTEFKSEPLLQERILKALASGNE